MDAAVEEEEQHCNPFLSSPHSVPSFQFRSEVSRARWNENMKMGEIIEKKGGIWTSIGVIRNGGKLYCTIEEIMFYIERGALHLLDANDTTVNLKDIYKKFAEGKSGCTWEGFQAYRHLKSLGYIVRRHGFPWTMKSERCCCTSTSHSNSTQVMMNENEKPSRESEESESIVQILRHLNIGEIKLDFDVYLPNSKFRITSPGDPSFILCLLSYNPPSRAEVENLEKQCNGVPLKFCNVDQGRVSIFSFERIELPVLP
uniref:tRNA-splicing endonuclease subunit SEN54 n=1 Tax=Anthurium amnicola TaxID=1678845 RepID=A0A1D1YH76_9ARAE